MDEIGRRPARCEIRVRGKLADHWSEWLGGLTISSTESKDGSSITTLTGTVADQAALRGILTKMWDLGLTLLYVNCNDLEGSTHGKE